jgi:hypothetical protein
MKGTPRLPLLAWAALGALGAPPAWGQAAFVDVTATHVPQDPGLHSLDAEFGDFDEDGDLDIAVAVENGANRLYLNDGKARFAPKAGAFSAAAADGEDLAVEDFDRDGHLDVIFVMEDGGVHQYYLGNGDATFRNVSARIPPCEANGVEAADLDNDGWKDVLIACAGGGAGAQDMLLLNDRKGGFANATSARLPVLTESSQDIKAADLDGDGDLDVVVGNESGRNRLLLNDGAGKFADAAAGLPIPYAEETREVLLVDVDNDGDRDIVFCNLTCNACGAYTRNPQVRLIVNDGKARFTDETAARLPPNTFSSWDGGYLDFDADGDQDLIVCAIAVPGFTGLPARAYRNDGKGRFTDATEAVMPAGASGRLWDVEVADLDRDGTLDVFMGAWGTQAVLLLGTVKQAAGIRKRRTGFRTSEDGLPSLLPGGKRWPSRAARFPFGDFAVLSDGSRSRPAPR